jgi:hypothetical protein
MTDYRYLGSWNFLLNKPILGESWMDEAEARACYETGGDTFTVVDADASEGVAPKFVLDVSPSRVDPRFRATFLNDALSVVEVVDYKTVDGRLFQWITVNFEYPDESTKYAMGESTLTVRGKTEPNGDGFLTINDKSKPTVEKISFHDVPVDDLWLPVPKFGEWEDLTKRTPGDAHLPSAAQP